MKALIVGQGGIGTALAKHLSSPYVGWRHQFFAGRKADEFFDRDARASDVVFLAISTKDKGEAALGYILRAIELGKPIVTCEKAALAYHFAALRPHLRKFGFTATVGGGSGMLALLADPVRFIDPPIKVTAIVNGTITFLAWAIQSGMSIDRAIEEAHRLGLPERGENNLAAIVTVEIEDALKKSAIIFNFSLESNDGACAPFITPDDFNRSLYYQNEIEHVLGMKGCRFVVAHETERHRPYFFDFEAFASYRKPFLITGSFVQNAEDQFGGISIDREQNALSLYTEAGGSRLMMGPGAGHTPTAAAMIIDAQLLLECSHFEIAAWKKS